MSRSKYLAISFLAATLALVLTAPALAQKMLRVAASPAEFVASDVPVGMFVQLERKLIVSHNDNIPRAVSISVVRPPDDQVRPGYSPIPDTTWVYFIYDNSMSVENAVLIVGREVEGKWENWSEVGVALDLPAWENLTNQRWEAWITLELVVEPGEIVAPAPAVRMKLETVGEVTKRSWPLLLLVAIAVVVAILALGIWARRRKAKKGVRGRVFSYR